MPRIRSIAELLRWSHAKTLREQGVDMAEVRKGAQEEYHSGPETFKKKFAPIAAQGLALIGGIMEIMEVDTVDELIEELGDYLIPPEDEPDPKDFFQS